MSSNKSESEKIIRQLEIANKNMVLEISARKQIERVLRNSEEKSKILFEFAPNGYYLSDLKGRFIDGNKAAEDLLGYKKEELIGKNYLKLKLLPAKELLNASKLLMKNIQGKGTGPNEFVLNHKDGSQIPVEVSTYPVKIEDQVVILGVVHDITERKKIENRLKENEEKFRSLVNSSPNIIMRVDSHGVINYINYDYSNSKVKDIIGKTIYSLIPLEFQEKARKTIAKVFKTGECYSFENLGISGDDSIIWYRNNIAPMIINGEIISATIIVMDVSERKQSEIMQNEFIASVSHEIRTPLTIIRESLSLLSDELLGKLNKDQFGIINPCIDDIDRLSRIINNLLDISRIEGQKIKLEREMVDIVKLVKSVLFSFEHNKKSKNIELVFNSNRKSVKLYIDKDRIIQVFMNLIGNAMKFTEKGKIEVLITKKTNEVVCCIADTGRGIEQNDLGTLFDRFHQVGKIMRAGEKGTGLGLSISKGIVKLHKGRIWVDSHINKGSKFYFALPMYSINDIIIENIDAIINKIENNYVQLSLIIIKLNNFSEIDSKFGIKTANKVTDIILHILRDTLASGEFSYIKEKDEIILFSDITKQNIIVLFSSLKDMLARSVLKIQKDITVDLSYGYSLYPNNGDNADELIQNAYKVL